MEKQKWVRHKALTVQLERKTNHPQTMGLKRNHSEEEDDEKSPGAEEWGRLFQATKKDLPSWFILKRHLKFRILETDFQSKLIMHFTHQSFHLQSIYAILKCFQLKTFAN